MYELRVTVCYCEMSADTLEYSNRCQFYEIFRIRLRSEIVKASFTVV